MREKERQKEKEDQSFSIISAFINRTDQEDKKLKRKIV